VHDFVPLGAGDSIAVAGVIPIRRKEKIMAEVKVTKEQPPAKREASPLARLDDFFTPMFPVGRFFGRRPFAVWRALHDELDRSFSGVGMAPKEEFWTPVVEVRKCNGDLVVTAELPGLRKEDVKVEMTDDALVIQGERKSEHKEDHEGYHRTERSYGRFYRSIPLPEGAKTDQVKAELADGVLKISIPAPETKKLPREVPIESGVKAKAA
jgi:HSP20 family protein